MTVTYLGQALPEVTQLVHDMERVNGQWPVGHGALFQLRDGYMMITRTGHDEFKLVAGKGSPIPIPLQLHHFGIEEVV